MKYIIIVLILISLFSCSTMPEGYQSSETELKHLEYGAWWGITIAGLSMYTYYYLDEKAQWF
ncbi:hypothetical protein KAR91_72685 [Candidatus Pacearchaeota archaeon]|nr:hypothetical protein [Candidatus Pacearchaeota archaeon]